MSSKHRDPSSSSTQTDEVNGSVQSNESMNCTDLQGQAVTVKSKVSQKGINPKTNHTCPLGLQVRSPSTPKANVEDMNTIMTTPTASGHSLNFKNNAPSDKGFESTATSVDDHILTPNTSNPGKCLQEKEKETKSSVSTSYLLHSETPPTLGFQHQRSIPVHRNPSNSAFTITSSTRSVKSIGSSIVDTDIDDSKSMNSCLSVLKDVPEVDLLPPIRSRGVETEDNHSFSGLVVQTEQPTLQTPTPTDVTATTPTTTHPPSSSSDFPLHTSAHHIMSSLSNIQSSISIALSQIQSENRNHHEKIKSLIQAESKQRMALESRFHSQLLLQSEAMIAMEMKLMRLEAKVEKKEALLHRRKGGGHGNLSILNPTMSHTSPMTLAPVGNLDVPSIPGIGGRLTIPSMNGPAQTLTIDEENDFEAMEIQVTSRESRTFRERETRGVLRGREPTNIAVVSSGASLASAVTATSFLDGDGVEDQTHVGTRDDDGVDGEASARSGDGDVEDEGDDDGVDVELDDGSNSSKSNGCHSTTRIRLLF